MFNSFNRFTQLHFVSGFDAVAANFLDPANFDDVFAESLAGLVFEVVVDVAENIRVIERIEVAGIIPAITGLSTPSACSDSTRSK